MWPSLSSYITIWWGDHSEGTFRPHACTDGRRSTTQLWLHPVSGPTATVSSVFRCAIPATKRKWAHQNDSDSGRPASADWSRRSLQVQLRLIVNTGVPFQSVDRQPEMHSWLWSTMLLDSAWETGMCGTSALKLVNLCLARSSLGSSHHRISLLRQSVKCQTTIPSIQRMPLSNSSLQTCWRTRSTSHRQLRQQRQLIRSILLFGLLQGVKTFHRMQFATQRMALLQDLCLIVQESFGSTWQDTCRGSSPRSLSHTSRTLSMSRFQLSGQASWIRTSSSMPLHQSARNGWTGIGQTSDPRDFPFRAQPAVRHIPSQPSRANPRRCSKCYCSHQLCDQSSPDYDLWIQHVQGQLDVGSAVQLLAFDVCNGSPV